MLGLEHAKSSKPENVFSWAWGKLTSTGFRLMKKFDVEEYWDHCWLWGSICFENSSLAVLSTRRWRCKIFRAAAIECTVRGARFNLKRVFAVGMEAKSSAVEPLQSYLSCHHGIFYGAASSVPHGQTLALHHNITFWRPHSPHFVHSDPKCKQTAMTPQNSNPANCPTSAPPTVIAY